MDDALMLTKINSETLEIEYVHQYTVLSPATGLEYTNKKIPAQFIQDKSEPTKMFLLGQFNQRASVIKFDKINAAVDWKLEIKSSDESNRPKPDTEMSEIYSYSQSERDN